MYPNLQTFLAEYERQYPEEILHIKQPISSKFEVTRLLAQLEKGKRFPVVICHQVMVEGRPSPFPLVNFLLSSRGRIARILETDIFRLPSVMQERLQRPQTPVVVSREDAPVKEIVAKGKDVDLTLFPALTRHVMDPGPYITAGFATMFDPDTGVDNSALHRGWIKDRDEIRLYLVPKTHNMHILAKYEARGEDAPIAYWVGHHPMFQLGCQVRVAFGESHYASAGALVGAGLRVVPSETLGEDFLVPADAEVVIEGYIPHGQRRPEGPFGEYTRYSGPQRWNPFIRVTAVTHRRGAYWDDIAVGHGHWVGCMAKEAEAFRQIQKAVPTLRNVHVPMSGAASLHIYVQIDKTMEGLGKTALLAALNSNVDFKHAFVFDADVDIFDDKEVLLALATRFQGDRDLLVLPGCVGPILDPSTESAVGTKVGFDCTKPAPPAPFSNRLAVPSEFQARDLLAQYVTSEELSRLPVEVWG